MVSVPLGGAASGAPADVQAMRVSVSSHEAHAHRVRLKITLTYDMQCGYPAVGPLVVAFPAAEKLPKQFAAGSVKLSGKAIAPAIKKRQVTVTIPPHNGVACGTIGPGVVTLTF